MFGKKPYHKEMKQAMDEWVRGLRTVEYLPVESLIQLFKSEHTDDTPARGTPAIVKST